MNNRDKVSSPDEARNYPLNCWYVAATSDEVGRKLLGRRLLVEAQTLEHGVPQDAVRGPAAHLDLCHQQRLGPANVAAHLRWRRSFR